MVGRQWAAPCKCISCNRLPRAESDAGRSCSAPIVHCISELDGSTRAIGSNVNSGCVGHNYRSATRDPLNGCRTYRHINFRDLKRRRRCTLPCWRNQLRNQLIGAGHLDTAPFRVGMVGGQRTTPGKRIRFRRLPWIEVDTGRSLTTPVVDCVIELDRAT